MNVKTCSRCDEIKPYSDFFKHSGHKDGVTSNCKKCKNSPTRKSVKINHIKNGVKQCLRCNNILSIEHFSEISDYHNADGYMCYCKMCKKIIDKLSGRKYRASKKGKETRKTRDESPCTSTVLFGKLPSVDKPIMVEGIITVLCKNCNKRIIPPYKSVMIRVNACNGTATGEGNFYCSDECKQSCTIFGFKSGVQIDPRSKQYIPKTEQQTARSCQTDDLKQLQCDTHGHNYCERCGDIIDVELHHTLTVAQHGTDAVSSAGHILLCAGCHVTVHKEGCYNA